MDWRRELLYRSALHKQSLCGEVVSYVSCSPADAVSYALGLLIKPLSAANIGIGYAAKEVAHLK